MTLDELVKEIEYLYESLKKPFARSGQELMDDLDYRCQWLARSAELLAEAQYHVDKRRGEEAERVARMDINTTLAKEIINGATANERRVLMQAEKLNSTLGYQIESIRSLLSFIKEEMKQLT